MCGIRLKYLTAVRKFVESKQIPHLLFYGPPGTGKTSTITAIAREIYGKNFRNMVLELNASDERGIDVVRGQIKNFAGTRQIFSSGFKLVILDEADAMTNVAQNALRRSMSLFFVLLSPTLLPPDPRGNFLAGRIGP